MKTAKELLETLELEAIEKNIFRGASHDIGVKHVFGGQVLSQSLHAAILTVPKERIAHSMHGYFILPGDQKKPIVYTVDETRNGGSFTTRRVKAVQNGKQIFVMACSFQKLEEGLEHQIDMSEVTHYSKLEADQVLMKKFAANLPPAFERYMRERPIEFRPENPMSFFLPEKQEPFRNVWFKATGAIPDDLTMHQRILSYASDYNLLTTAILPHQDKVNVFNLQMASLDHAMWFHRAFKANEWLLYKVDSPSASNARGFTRGSIFDEAGRLVASVVQEGLMRKKQKRAKPS